MRLQRLGDNEYQPDFPRRKCTDSMRRKDFVALVHNLHAFAWGRHVQEPHRWVISFENRVRELLLAEEYRPLIDYENQLGSEAELAVPTPDHYLPLLYVAGTRTRSERLTFPVEGVDGGSVSMLAIRVR
jgi:4,5-DOPA dioxygenase extradiol